MVCCFFDCSAIHDTRSTCYQSDGLQACYWKLLRAAPEATSKQGCSLHTAWSPSKPGKQTADGTAVLVPRTCLDLSSENIV